MSQEEVLVRAWFGDGGIVEARRAAGASRAAALADSLELRPLPAEVGELAQLLVDPEFRVGDVARRLERLPVVAARLLRLANSAQYGGQSPVSEVREAVLRVGGRTVRELALAVSVLQQFPDDGGVGAHIHAHSAEVAEVARIVAALWSQGEVPDLFLTALLHDVGKLLLLQSGEFAYPPPDLETGALHTALDERAELGFDHGLLGGIAARRWGIPDPAPYAIAWHHSHGAALRRGGEIARVVCMLDVAHGMAEALRTAVPPDVHAMAARPHSSWLGLEADDLQDLWDGLQQTASGAAPGASRRERSRARYSGRTSRVTV